MKNTIPFLICAFFAAAPALSFGQTDPEPREFEMKDGDTTYIMKKYWFVMLIRGDKAAEFSKEELEKIQAGHMANINKWAEAGKIIMAGPFGDDTAWRGILVMDCETEAEARAIVEEDPAVRAGRLKFEMHPWWAAKGTVLK